MTRKPTDHDNMLKQSFAQLSGALQKLQQAADAHIDLRNNQAQSKELVQEEITESWKKHTAEIESARDALTEENTFLKEDNLRLSNQLQALQQEYLALQEVAGQTLNRLDGSIKQLDMLLEH
jgi:predicted nuclease with TOPRIM domain